MKLDGNRILVTGGAGFIGSHLVDLLAEKNSVTVADNLSPDRRKTLNKKANYVNIDLLNKNPVSEAVKNVDLVVHLAANPLASLTASSEMIGNITMTYNILEAMKENNVNNMAFASSAIIYGNAPVPTKESYGPLKPNSLYAASKLACEALISAYCHTFNMKSWVFRFANVGGPRLRHGPAHDFITKLRNNPSELEVLGDGSQERCYLHVADCVDGIARVIENADSPVNIINLGAEDVITIKRIAEIVIEEMKLKAKLKFTAKEPKGWKGDVKIFQPDITLAKNLGWKPKRSSEETVRDTVRSLVLKSP
ncbi:MAG: NAD-dependent epimerase/dehydratase family protein [Candidatus Aenigmarchaeota archaeon]|nr:NAD-dependent epimerase/dehydratase family protein [Candidatus Aenigmarchaeota archaeon]